MRRISTLLFLPLVACSYAASAAPYLINPQLSRIELNWEMIGGGHYHARISGVHGEVAFDPQQDTGDAVTAAMPIARLDAHHALLTRALQSSAFFDNAHYPEAEFTSSRLVALGEGRYRVFGSLQIKRVRKPIILYAQQSSLPGQRLRLSAQTTLSRSAYGMGQYPALVSDAIGVEIVLYADRQNRVAQTGESQEPETVASGE